MHTYYIADDWETSVTSMHIHAVRECGTETWVTSMHIHAVRECGTETWVTSTHIHAVRECGTWVQQRSNSGCLRSYMGS